MKTVFCSSCGNAIEDNQRFCRKCGQPINLSEATTRTLDAPSVIEPTTPSYLYPAGAQPMPAPDTTGLRPSGQKRMVVIVASLVGFLLGALIVLAVVTSMISHNAPPTQPAVTPPQMRTPPPTPTPPVATTPPAPGVSPPPAPPVVVGGAAAISRDMVYPGARITTEIGRAGGSSALQLQTEDSFDKVVAWYTAKLKPIKTVKTEGPTAILQGESLTAIINGTGNGASIFLKQGRDAR